MSEKWNIQGSRVYGDGKSFNLNNRITATQLQSTLNTYENTIQQYETQIQQYNEIEQKLDKIQKTVIQLQLTCGIMSEELKKLHEETL